MRRTLFQGCVKTVLKFPSYSFIEKYKVQSIVFIRGFFGRDFFPIKKQHLFANYGFVGENLANMDQIYKNVFNDLKILDLDKSLPKKFV